MESRCFLGDIFTHIRRNADHIFVILISLIFLVRLLYLDADAKSL